MRIEGGVDKGTFRIYFLSLFLCFALFSSLDSTASAATNVLQNTSFESGTGTGGGSTITNWTLFASSGGGGTVFAERASGNQTSGSFSLKLGSFGGPGFEFSFAFQEVTSGFTIGDTVTFAVNAKNTAGAAAARLIIKIEFRTSSSSLISEVSSSDITNSPTYSSSSISGTVPSGTEKIVFTIVNEMNGGGSSEYFVDDVSASFAKRGSATAGSACGFPTNAGFEETGSSGEEIMPGWTRFPFQSTLVNQKDNSTLTHFAPEGTHALEINPTSGQFSGVFQTVSPIPEGQSITFSAFARTDNMNASAGGFGQLKLEFKDVDDNLLETFLSDKIDRNNASGDFKQFSVSGSAPEGTSSAVLVFVAEGSGTIVFDAACSSFEPSALPIKITGDVFNALNGELLAKAHVQLLNAEGDVIATDDDNPFEFEVESGSSRMLRAIAEGFTFPSLVNVSVIQGDHGEIFSYTSDTKISLPMDPGYPLTIKKDVNKKQAARGELLVYKISVKNNSIYPIDDVILIDELPDVFRYRSGTAQRNGQKITDPTQNSPLTFDLGTVGGSEELVISYVALVGSKAELGREYVTPAVGQSSSLGFQLSNKDSAGPVVIADPIFDLGTVIGKVFNDENKNGVQDRGERGVPDVRLATEEGTVVYTDRHGKYHIPGVKPGRHIVKIDRHSLPSGTELVTEEAYLVKITEGLLAKVNFAVHLPPGSQIPASYHDQLEVHVTQQYDKFIAKLNVLLNQEELHVLADQLVEPAYFYIDGNYLDAVSAWKITVRDDRGVIIKTLSDMAPVPARVEWDGRTEDGILVRPERSYTYQLWVTDGVREDWTVRKTFRVTTKRERPSEVQRASFVQLEENERARQSIPITNHNAVMVRGHAQPGTTVKINGHEVYVKEDGTFEKEILLPPGVQVVKIANTDEAGKTLTYVREIDIQEDYFFMVGFAEGEIGSREVDAHLDEITEDDAFEDGFYEEGRIAYYLKGKIKGKYLITSSLDTARSNKTKLFTNMDPDRFYPVYGDASEISYEATDTKNNFYILAEVDKSYVKWGSFETGLTDLELATFNRTLGGAKGHIERGKTTRYGDSYGAATVFYATAEAAPDHNEFLGTGGSLYYLKNRNAIEGSEKIQIVYRDKITGRILSRVDLVEGTDYEIDYLQGRIILTRPLSLVSAPNTIISSSILDGNTASLVVDYEYQPSSPFENPTRGGRVYHYVTDNVRLGGTFVDEEREGPDYKLLGGDVLVKLGRYTQLSAEYAQSREDQSTTNVSSDGGITFAERDPVFFGTVTGNTGSLNVTLEELERLDEEDFLNFQPELQEAYSFKFQTGLWDRLSLKSYYTFIEKDFSNTSTLLQEGTQKIGGELSYRMGPRTFLNVRHDTQEVIDEPLETVGLFSPTTVGGFDLLSASILQGEKNHTTTAQITHEVGKWGLIGEYRHQEINDPLTLDDPLAGFFEFSDESDDIVAARATYHWSGKFIPFVEQQVTVSGEDNHQTSLGADLKLNSKIWLQGQETLGTRGNSTLVGLQAQTSEKTSIYVNQMIGYDDVLGNASRTTFGSHTQVDEKSKFTTEKQYTSYRKGQLESSLFGYETRLKKGWALGANYERIDGDGGLERDAVSGTLSYSKWNWLSAFTKLEFRQDEVFSTSSQRQYLTQNLVKWQTTEDLELLGRFNYGFTEDRIGNSELAEFYEAGTGFAYRPVDYDRLNFIGKYTYLNDDNPDSQSDFDLNILERSHLASIEGAFDINRWFQLVEKYAFKMGEVSVEGSDFSDVKTHLWINRINFHITRKWDIAGEYRIRNETVTDDKKSGFLIEIDREIMDHIRFGAGYNFTDFSDDLSTGANDDAHGFFVRLTGKF